MNKSIVRDEAFSGNDEIDKNFTKINQYGHMVINEKFNTKLSIVQQVLALKKTGCTFKRIRPLDSFVSLDRRIISRLINQREIKLSVKNYVGYICSFCDRPFNHYFFTKITVF